MRPRNSLDREGDGEEHHRVAHGTPEERVVEQLGVVPETDMLRVWADAVPLPGRDQPGVPDAVVDEPDA